MFAEPDPCAFKDSHGTLHVCKYLGRNGTRVIDAKWITDVVGMVPFKYVQRQKDYVEDKQYFAVEKMSAVLIGRCNGEDIDKGDSDSEE